MILSNVIHYFLKVKYCKVMINIYRPLYSEQIRTCVLVLISVFNEVHVAIASQQFYIYTNKITVWCISPIQPF